MWKIGLHYHAIHVVVVINVVVVIFTAVVDKYNGNDEGGEKRLSTVIGWVLNENLLHTPND